MAETFTSLDTLRQMGLVSLIYNGNHQLCLKFSCAGTGITFTGSMDSALIIAAIKQQMTVDSIGLQGMVGPMGGMMTEYVPPPALPTVSDTMYLFNSSGGLGVGQINTLKDFNNNTVDYDTTACYACQNCMDSSGVAKNPTSLAIVNESGILKVTNISDNYISVYYVRTKKCSSNLATVITVYDSSNNPYNAFKYTSDGTDYYYVLDGTQTDWTDDLSSIGYKLPMVGWLNADHTDRTYLDATSWYSLYDDSGSLIVGDSLQNYTLLNLWLDGIKLTNDTNPNTGYKYPVLRVYDGKLQLQVAMQNYNKNYALTNITYLITPTT